MDARREPERVDPWPPAAVFPAVDPSTSQPSATAATPASDARRSSDDGRGTSTCKLARVDQWRNVELAQRSRFFRRVALFFMCLPYFLLGVRRAPARPAASSFDPPATARRSGHGAPPRAASSGSGWPEEQEHRGDAAVRQLAVPLLAVQHCVTRPALQLELPDRSD